MGETHELAGGAQVVELVRRPPPFDRQVGCRGPQVLAQGEDAHAGVAQVGHRPAHLVVRLAHPEDDPGFGHEAGVGGAGEDGQAPGVGGRRAHHPLEPGDRLEVVIEDVGPDTEDRVEGVGVALAVGDEKLDSRARATAADRAPVAAPTKPTPIPRPSPFRACAARSPT